MKCPQCNAPIEDDAEQCNYCGIVTEQGKAARKARMVVEVETNLQRAKTEAEAQRRAQAQAQALRGQQIQAFNSAITRSMVVSIAGQAVCCIPLAGVIGFFIAKGAKADAAKNQVPDAGRGTLAQVVSMLSLAFSLFVWGLVAAAGINESREKARLRAIIANEENAPALTLSGACAIGELEIINQKYEGYETFNYDLSCAGEVTPIGADEARLTGAHFKKDDKQIDVVVCFKRTSKWTVKQVRGDERCDEPPPPKPPKK